MDIVWHPGNRPKPPCNHGGCLPRGVEIQEAGRGVSGERYEYCVPRIAAGNRSAVQHAAIGHHPTVTASAILNVKSQPLGGRHPAQPGYCAVLLRVASPLPELVLRANHFSQLWVVAPEVRNVQLLEYPFACLHPIRQTSGGGRDERFRPGFLEHLPVPGGLPSREVDWVSPHEFTHGSR